MSSLGCADPGCVGLPPTVVRRLHAAEAGHLVCVLKPPFVLPQYFVSSGFAFVHPDSTAEVCAVEAVPLEHLDGAAAMGVAAATAGLIAPASGVPVASPAGSV